MEGESRSEDVVTEKAKLLCLSDRSAKSLHRERILGSYVDVALVSTAGNTRDHHTLKHSVGVALHYTSVHKCAGVTLVAVTNDISLLFLLALYLLPLFTCGEATASSTAKLGLGYLRNDVISGHIEESLLKCGISTDSNILTDRVGIYLTAVLKHHSCLLLVEGDLGLLSVDLAVLLVCKAVNALAAENSLLNYLLAVLCLYLCVKPSLGLDAEKRTHFAEAVAAALLKSDLLAVRILHKLNGNGKSLCLHKLLESGMYLKRSAGNATRARANDDLSALRTICLFRAFAVGGKFFSAFKHSRSPPSVSLRAPKPYRGSSRDEPRR